MQLAKTQVLIFSKEFDKSILCKELLLAKEESSSSINPSLNLIFVKFIQLKNAFLSTFWVEFGKKNSSKPENSKHLNVIDLILFGIDNSFKLLHPLKAKLPILFTVVFLIW